MAIPSDIITKACDGAVEEIKKEAPEEYFKLDADRDRMANLRQAANNAATEYVELAEKFGYGPSEKIWERLDEHLSRDRFKLIQGGLSIPTFRMDIAMSDGKYWVLVTRDGATFLPARALETPADSDWATIQQYASVILEAVMLAMSAAGISISPSSNGIGRAVKKAVDAIQASSKLQEAMEDFIKAWNGSDSPLSRAEAMLGLIRAIIDAGIFSTIIKTVCSDMPWCDWLVIAAMVFAMILAALASGQAALIAKFALAATLGFAKKIANVVRLSEIKQSQ